MNNQNTPVADKIAAAAAVGLVNTREEAQKAAATVRAEWAPRRASADRAVASAKKDRDEARHDLDVAIADDERTRTYSKAQYGATLELRQAEHRLKNAKIDREMTRLNAAYAASCAALAVYDAAELDLWIDADNPWDAFED